MVPYLANRHPNWFFEAVPPIMAEVDLPRFLEQPWGLFFSSATMPVEVGLSKASVTKVPAGKASVLAIQTFFAVMAAA